MYIRYFIWIKGIFTGELGMLIATRNLISNYLSIYFPSTFALVGMLWLIILSFPVARFAFLGLGLPSGTPEWGAMLNVARTCLYTHPEMLIYLGVCILITAGGFNLFGEALRDILSADGGI